jgi:hypothetical protein
MNVLLIRIALIFIVALVVGGATYVVLTIVEIIKER